ncbi:cytochrome b/b6 domain-containing protein [Paracoccus sp. (in: a-proteobacteria)]|uniref:cytochrome b/b6 domain-containing protein n=1 Tax=Paracoccus sp. TaxID=267 RepID=UPI00396CCB52
MSDRVWGWDGLVRLFHWSLLGPLAEIWLTSKGRKGFNGRLGYVVSGRITAQVVRGLIGPHHVLFADIIRSPSAVLASLRDLRAGRTRRSPGHNPAGGVMIVVLLTITGAVLTGWLQTTGAFSGSFAMEAVHEVLATLLLVLAGLHVAGVLFERLPHNETLVLSMLTGTRRPLSDRSRR